MADEVWVRGGEDRRKVRAGRDGLLATRELKTCVRNPSLFLLALVAERTGCGSALRRSVFREK
jgi:hypothetical protein